MVKLIPSSHPSVLLLAALLGETAVRAQMGWGRSHRAEEHDSARLLGPAGLADSHLPPSTAALRRANSWGHGGGRAPGSLQEVPLSPGANALVAEASPPRSQSRVDAVNFHYFQNAVGKLWRGARGRPRPGSPGGPSMQQQQYERAGGFPHPMHGRSALESTMRKRSLPSDWDEVGADAA